MIRGLHAMFYSPEAEELRTLFRDKLKFPFVDTGDGWLIFDAPAAEIGCHPAETRFYGLSFYCDTLERTMATLQKRGVKFTTGIRDEEWGRVTRFQVPGGGEVELYQPKYTKHRRTRRARARAVRARVKRSR